MSARLRRLALSAALLIVALPAAAAHADVTPITIGAVFSQTGAAAAYGPSQVRGAQLAVQQLNARGIPSPGVPLALVVRDDGSTPAGASAAFTSLLDGGASMLLGPTLSGAALIADPVAQLRGVPVMGVSNTVDGITDIGNFVFRNSLPERVVQPATVRAAKRRYGIRRAAIVWTTPDAYSAGARVVFRTALKAHGVRVPVDTSWPSGDTAALDAALAKAARARPDALVISALQGDAVAAMVQARRIRALRDVRLIGGNALNAPGLYAATGGAAEGAVSGTAWVPSRRTGHGALSSNEAFVKAYRAAYGVAPDQFAAQAYAGVVLYARAMVNAGSTVPARIRDALAALRGVPTILGRFSFDRRRNPHYTPAVVVQHKGRQLPISG